MEDKNQQSVNSLNLTRATEADAAVREEIENLFKYQPWTPNKVRRGEEVRSKLIEAYISMIDNVPPCPTRTRALNALTDARMLANAAISFDGKY